MARLKYMLEPGETVLLSNTDDRMVWWRAGILALWLTAIFVPDFVRFGTEDPKFWQMIAVFVLMVALIPFWAWTGRVWLWAVTDRRILARAKPGSTVKTAALSSIKAAEIDGDRLRLAVGSGTLELPLSNRFCKVGKLRGALGDRLGNAGRPVAALSEILSPEETPRLRTLPEFAFMNIATPVVLAAGVPAIFLVTLFERGPGLLPVILAIAPLIYELLFAELVAAWRRRGWWIAVTDRRLLLRRWYEPERYDAFAVGDIGLAEYDTKAGRLLVHCGDRTLFLICGKSSAHRILTALDRDPQEVLA